MCKLTGTYVLEQLQLSNQICHRLYVASNAVTRAYRPLLKELDITYPQYVVMMALWQFNDIEVGRVQSLTKIDAGALTQILKKMVDKGLVCLTPTEEDRRVKRVNLTKAGRELEQKASDIPLKLMCHLKGLESEDIQKLKTVLDILVDNVLLEE